jgi:hypothetical protein
MDEIETSEEGNNPGKQSKKSVGGMFSEWTEALKQLVERARQQPGLHLLMALTFCRLFRF